MVDKITTVPRARMGRAHSATWRAPMCSGTTALSWCSSASPVERGARGAWFRAVGRRLQRLVRHRVCRVRRWKRAVASGIQCGRCGRAWFVRHSSCGWPVRRCPARCRPRPGAVRRAVVRDRATWRWRPGSLLHRAAARAGREPRRRRRAAAPAVLAIRPGRDAGRCRVLDVDFELPEAPDLTPFPGATTLVAWAATPQFDSEMRLGEVRPGVTRVVGSRLIGSSCW